MFFSVVAIKQLVFTLEVISKGFAIDFKVIITVEGKSFFKDFIICYNFNKEVVKRLIHSHSIIIADINQNLNLLVWIFIIANLEQIII